MATPTHLPTDPDELAEVLGEADPEQVNKLYDALVAGLGRDRANALWNAACASIDHDAETDRRQAELAEALTTAQREVGKARNALNELRDGSAWHVDYAEGSAGADIAAFLTDTDRTLRAAEALDQPNRRVHD